MGLGGWGQDNGGVGAQVSAGRINGTAEVPPTGVGICVAHHPGTRGILWPMEKSLRE